MDGGILSSGTAGDLLTESVRVSAGAGSALTSDPLNLIRLKS